MSRGLRGTAKADMPRMGRALVALLVALVVALSGCTGATDGVDVASTGTEETSDAGSKAQPGTTETGASDDAATSIWLSEEGSYTSKDEVAWYLYTYGHLPDNYVTKDEAEDAGWKTLYRTVGEACPGMSIGGSYFGNYEGRLPKAKGRTWYECDIDYEGGSRGPKRLVYSSDGLIYYTEDHYQTFERLY